MRQPTLAHGHAGYSAFAEIQSQPLAETDALANSKSHCLLPLRGLVQQFFVILYDLYGHVERLRDEIAVPFVHLFDYYVFGRVAASIVVPNVSKLVGERATPGEAT